MFLLGSIFIVYFLRLCGEASNMEQYENNLGAEWQKFKHENTFVEADIPKNMLTYEQEEKETQSSKRPQLQNDA